MRSAAIDKPMHCVLPRLQVLIYRDEGVNLQSADALAGQLRAILDQAISIQQVDSLYLNTEPWEDKTIALVMGGGVCGEWEIRLGEKGIRKIHDYVIRGGKYIGFCAGAYFASAKSRFDIKDQLPIKKRRSLAFFEGKAKGPLIETDDYRSIDAARAAKVAFIIRGVAQSGYLYYQGGCFFDIDQDTAQTRIVGRYEYPFSSRPAAVHCKVGKGEAFLCGPHPEFSWTEELKQSAHRQLAFLAQTLCPEESFRKRIWEEIGRMLALPL